jgi:hypothetical protein
MSVIYEVTVMVRADLIKEYETYMLSQHIPDLLHTGAFVEASLSRSEHGRYKINYVSKSRRELDEYLGRHAARLRADLMSRFPDGIELSREIWEVIGEFDHPGV